MAYAEAALPPPLAPAAHAPEPVPVVVPAPEPAVVALTPGVKQAVNFHFRY